VQRCAVPDFIVPANISPGIDPTMCDAGMLADFLRTLSGIGALTLDGRQQCLLAIERLLAGALRANESSLKHAALDFWKHVVQPYVPRLRCSGTSN
jgi:hypothetical protein